MMSIKFSELLSSGAEEARMGRKGYSGRDKKLSVIYQGRKYMLKVQSRLEDVKNNDLRASYSNSPFSEHISCLVIKSMGLPVQNTFLGEYGGKAAVACEDFMQDYPASYQLQEFSYLENSFMEEIKISRTPYLESINAIFDRHPLLDGIREEAKQRYWDTFVCDAFIGNFDRHAGNWGYIVDIESDRTILAPIYDCGSSLFPELDDDRIAEELHNRQHMDDRLFVYPTAALIGGNDKRVKYHEYLLNGENTCCRKALRRLYPRIDMKSIISMIGSADGISNVRKEFYSHVLKDRYEKILTPAYEKCHANSRGGISAPYIPAARSEQMSLPDKVADDEMEV